MLGFAANVGFTQRELCQCLSRSLPNLVVCMTELSHKVNQQKCPFVADWMIGRPTLLVASSQSHSNEQWMLCTVLAAGLDPNRHVEVLPSIDFSKSVSLCVLCTWWLLLQA